MKVKYTDINFRRKSLELIELVNGIVSQYKQQGYGLTLRQVYYQMVARGYIPNDYNTYKSLGSVINDGRLAGLIDWDAIVDRTRHIRRELHWRDPEAMINSAGKLYALDKWKGQPNYVEVWVEKDALVDIVGQACSPLDTPYFSTRGYTSQSEMWSAAQRFIENDYRAGRYIIYLGDHDPSGMNMTDDIQKRMAVFGADVQVKRVALTLEQISTYNPPPNMAKKSDKRSKGYVAEYGSACWELDALDPGVLVSLITDEVTALRDDELYKAMVRREERDRGELLQIRDHYYDVVTFLN